METPVAEKELIHASLIGDLEEARGHNDVRIHVIVRQGHHAAGERCKRFHAIPQSNVRTSVMRPVTAAAAAVNGLARKVRPPLPWRPSKLRLLVETLYWPGFSSSPFMAMHMLHPGSRHSHPASRKIECKPSLSACRLTSCDPGTTSTRTPGFTLRPLRTAAAARRSEMRELVQLPMKTTSTECPSSGLPGGRSM